MGMMSKASALSCLIVVLFSICFVEGRDFVVGGNENSWKVPKSGDDLNKWAQNQRFQIGDYLVFKFNPGSDSVLQVKEEDYKKCQTQNPIESYTSSNTKIELKTQGPVFFISGVKDNCDKGLKVELEVLSPNHGHHHHGHSSPAPSPSVGAAPSIFDAPAPAPANGGSSLKIGVVGGVIALAVGLAMF